MNEQYLFDRLFGLDQHQLVIAEFFLQGKALVAGQEAVVIGTRNHAAIDTTLALRIAAEILEVVRTDRSSTKPRPIIFIVDTQGQALSRHEELLGLNGYFAHVARCVDIARRRGHRLITVIHGEAVSGGFLAFGMLADGVFALPDAQVRVMNLQAMSRVTKISLEQLQGLAADSPVFAPGAENYWCMGGIHQIWTAEDEWADCLARALNTAQETDERAALGLERGGRHLAANIKQIVENA